jgi:hypothetical protein
MSEPGRSQDVQDRLRQLAERSLAGVTHAVSQGNRCAVCDAPIPAGTVEYFVTEDGKPVRLDVSCRFGWHDERQRLASKTPPS